MATEDLLEAKGSVEVGEKLDLPPATTPREDNTRLIDWIGKEKAGAKPHIDQFREAAKECYRFRDGHQLSDVDEKALRNEGRPNSAFNSTQKYIRYVTGVERFAPEALIFSAINESEELAQAYSEFVTRAYDWAIAKGNGDFARSEAFGDLVTCGMGWEDYYISRTRDPKGLPRMTRISPLEMLWPACNVQNLGGAEADPGTRWRARETEIDKDEAIARWPDQEPLINAAVLGRSEQRPERGTVIHEIRDVKTVPIDQGHGNDIVKKNSINVLEWQWFDDEDGYYFYDPLQDEDAWLSKREFMIYRNRLPKITGKKISDYVQQFKRCFWKVFLLNSKHMLGKKMRMPGDMFSFNCMTSYFDQDEKQWYGYVRLLIDPQKYGNKFFNQVIEIMGHQAKGGLEAEEDAIPPKNVEAIKRDYAKPGSVTIFSQNAISQNKVRQKTLPQLPAASMQVMDFCVKAMESVTGIDPDQYGQGGGNMPGVTLRQKQKAGLLLLAQEFDSLSLFRRDEGKIILQHLAILADDRLIRVGGAMPGEGQVLKLLRQPFTLEYDLNLDDTERDPNIRRLYEENVMAIAPTLIRMNWFVPELLDWFRLPWWFKQKLKQAIMQKAQMDQQMTMMGINTKGRGANKSPQERQAAVEKTQADTMLQRAKADRILGQRRRDEVKTLLEIVSSSLKGRIDRESHQQETAKRALELFDAATGRNQRTTGKRSLPAS